MDRVLFIILLFFCLNVFGQDKPIVLKNASFESIIEEENVPKEWTKLEESPNSYISKPAIDGAYFLSLSTRDNQINDAYAQKLSSPLSSEKCYMFQIGIATSNSFGGFVSAFDNKEAMKAKPCILKIWGGYEGAYKDELLAQTVPIDHNDWDSYTFYLCPDKPIQYLLLEANYSPEEKNPYNGNVLIDDCSMLFPLNYADGEILWEEIPKVSYVDVEDIDMMEVMIQDYGSKLSFEGFELSKFIYLDEFDGIHYGNMYFNTIFRSMLNFIDETMVIGVKGRSEKLIQTRVNQLKDIIRNSDLPLYSFKIRPADQLEDYDWIINTGEINIAIDQN